MRDEGVYEMTARERVLAIRLVEQQKKKPELFEKLGVHVSIKKVESTVSERRKKYV